MDKITPNKIYHLVKMTKYLRSLDNDTERRRDLRKEAKVYNRLLEFGINAMIEERKQEIIKVLGEKKAAERFGGNKNGERKN